jgi:hypothetical protein
LIGEFEFKYGEGTYSRLGITEVQMRQTEPDQKSKPLGQRTRGNFHPKRYAKH